MLDDALKSVKAYLYDRSASPLMGSFICSWLIWNHRLVMTMLSGDLSITNRFHYVDNVLYGGPYDWIWMGIAGPLLTALAYIYLYPLPALKTFEYARGRQKILNDRRQAIEEERLLSVEESRKIRGEIYRIQEDAANTIERLNERIALLEQERSALMGKASSADEDEEIESLTRNAEEYRDNMSKADELREKYWKERDEVLQEVFAAKAPIDQSEVAESLVISAARAEYHLKDLKKEGCVKWGHLNGHTGYVLTDSGLEKVIAKGLDERAYNNLKK